MKIRTRSVFALIAGLAVLSLAACGGAESRKAQHLAKGEAFLAAENFEKARVEFRNALQIAPKDPTARFDMGLVDEKLDNPREAAQFYQSTIDADPSHFGARAKLARLYLFSGAPDKALALIEPALEKRPNDPELLTIRAAGRIQKKETAEARADAERAVQLAPTNGDAAAVLAGIYSGSGESAMAITLLEQSIQRIPDTVELRLVLAQLYAQNNRASDAEALLMKVAALQPAEKAHRLRLAQFYAQLNQVDAAEGTLRQAIKDMPNERSLKLALVDFLAARKSRETAEKELKAMIAAAPADSELEFALAKFYEAGQQTAQAEAIYKEVIGKEKFGPAGLSARNHLAALRYAAGDIPDALTLTQEVLEKSPRDDDALDLRGNISLIQNDPRAAIADLRAVLRDQPNAVGVLRTLARAHLANGEPAVAEETLRHAVESNPKDPVLQLDFAKLLAELGKPEQAKAVIAALVMQEPDNFAALDTQFRVAMTAKDMVTARSAAKAMLALRPKSAVGNFYQGLISEGDGRADEARQQYAAAVDLEPDAREPLQAEVALLVKQKKTDQALKRLDALIMARPDNAFAPDLKGDVLMANGRPADAEAAYRISITRAPKWWPGYHGLALAEITAKETDAAIDTLRKAEATGDRADLAGLELAAVLESQGKYDVAATQYDELLHRYPDSKAAMNNFAMLLVTHKQDRASLDKAKTLAAGFADSSNPSFLDTYGWVLYKRGETAASVPVLERVVAKLPNEPTARYHLGMAQLQLGSSAEARDNLTRAVNSGAKFPGLDEAKSTLDKLAKLPATANAVPRT
jgi:tetratricopeptide (TPR) repeat protein